MTRQRLFIRFDAAEELLSTARLPRGRLLAAAAFLTVLPGPARARDWVEVSSPHFVVASDAGEARARLVATELEQTRALFARLTDVRLEPRRPLLVVAVNGESALRQLLPGFWEGKGHFRPGGVLMPVSDRDYIVLRADNPTWSIHAIDHEYVHRLTALTLVRFPAWLVEGLAGFFETIALEGSKISVGRIDDKKLKYLRDHKLLPLRKLLTADYQSREFRDQGYLFYAEAALLTNYLVLGPGRNGDALGSLTKILHQGLEGDPETKEALGDLKELEKALRAYIDGGDFRFRVLPVQVVEAPLTARPLSAGEAAAIRGNLLAIQGRAEARPLLEEALRLESLLSAPQEGLAKLSLAQGRREEAREHLALALRLDPENAFTYYWLSVASAPGSDARESALRRAIALAPDFAPAQELLANLLMERRGKFDEAERLARRAMELEPQAASCRIVLAGTLRRAGRADDALQVEQELRQRAAKDEYVRSQMVWYYERAGRLAEADALLADALAESPNDAHILEGQADIFFHRKRFDEAETFYRKALKVQPDSSRLMDSLAFMNADRNVRVEEALALSSRALTFAPSDASYMDSRGLELYRLGRLPEAEAELRRAIERWEAPVVIEHLGDVRQARGDPREAMSLWRRAVERDDIGDEAADRVLLKIRAAELAQDAPQQPR